MAEKSIENAVLVNMALNELKKTRPIRAIDRESEYNHKEKIFLSIQNNIGKSISLILSLGIPIYYMKKIKPSPKIRDFSLPFSKKIEISKYNFAIFICLRAEDVTKYKIINILKDISQINLKVLYPQGIYFGIL